MRLFKQVQKLQHEDETDSALITPVEIKKKLSPTSLPKKLSPTSLPRLLFGSSKRKVSFAEVPAFIDTDEFDIHAQWLSKDELKEILVTLKKEGSKMLSSNGEVVREDNDDYCFRGLEHRTVENSRARQRNKEMVWEAVLMHQHLYNGKCDPMTVAAASIRYSTLCRREALVRAQQDEEFVVKYLTNER